MWFTPSLELTNSCKQPKEDDEDGTSSPTSCTYPKPMIKTHGRWPSKGEFPCTVLVDIGNCKDTCNCTPQ